MTYKTFLVFVVITYFLKAFLRCLAKTIKSITTFYFLTWCFC